MKDSVSKLSAASALFTLAAALPVSASAQTYLPAEGGRVTNIGQNGWLGGQRSDLDFTFENLQYQTRPCPNPKDGDVIIGLTFEIHIDWKSVAGYRQAESSGDANGPEQFLFKYQGQSRWHLESVTRDGNSVIGGANPEGEEGNAGGDGAVNITPPGNFEDSTGDDSFGLVYKYSFKYSPIEEECRVVPLRIRGTYRHTYDGPLSFSFDNAISLGGSYPWGVSLGVSGRFKNNHMWSKELFNPNGTKHWKELLPPKVIAQEVPCCGSSNTHTPPPPFPPEGDVGVPNGNPTIGPGDQFNYNVLFPGGGYGLTSTEIEATTPDGQLLGESSFHFDSPIFELVGDGLTVDVPAGYPYDEIILSATAVNAAGLSSHVSQSLTVMPATSVPTLGHQVSLASQQRVLVGEGFAPGSMVIFYTYTPQLVGDLDFDLDVDQDDLDVFLTTEWGPADDLDDLHADLDLNGDVDGDDLEILFENMGTDEKGAVSLLGCPETIVEVPAVNMSFAFADGLGRAEVALDDQASGATRLIYGAVQLGDCLEASPVNLLNR